MDLAGIGAVAAAAVAAVGIPAAVLVGRWQARAGIAQAEASYRAALDAVRASGGEAHAQWLRSTRREAYAALLLAAGRTLDVARLLVEDATANKIPPDQRNARTAEFEAQISQLQNAGIIVSLEGPDDVARHTNSMVGAVIGASYLAKALFERRVAWHDVIALTREDDCPREVQALYSASVNLNYVRSQAGVGSLLGRDDADLPEDVAAARRALQACRNALPSAFWGLAAEMEKSAGGEDETATNNRRNLIAGFEQSRDQFINAARTVLRPTHDPHAP